MAGCYVPRIYAGPPGVGKDTYRLGRTAGVRIFYSPRLRSKLNSNRIGIKMKRFLFLRWLELEDAGTVVCASREEPPI
ncbi:MAG: hypothetical protein PHN75_13545 [Syntrophales bacterium]|nr:hypothetical protein [Syntrophales bacterium]